MSGKKRYVQVGLGARHFMFRDAILGQFADTSDLVGLCDSNPARLALSAAQAKAKNGRDIPTFAAEDFDRMVRETRADAVIVTSMDCTHDRYICRAMELGLDAITEKPMTMDAERCRKILETQRRTGRRVRVTFNYRYSPPRTQVKDVLMSGVIGNVLSVDFHWVLDTRHGADYFRRWHRWKKNSGGLLVHKATHHFDLVNWWIGSVPETVFATGRRAFYRPETAVRYGLAAGERCHTCPEKARCRFRLDLSGKESLKSVYLDAESHDGYFRDRCVFSADMDIEDSMAVSVEYRSGVRLSYSLNAFMPWEGYQIAINGTRGRLEHKCQESVYVSGDGSVPGALKKEGTWLRIYPHWRPAYEIPTWTGSGGHGGGDTVLLNDLFGEKPEPDRFLRAADHRGGAWSILTGIAANDSIASGRPVRVSDLVSDLALPDYPPMPTAAEPLEMPPGEP